MSRFECRLALTLLLVMPFGATAQPTPDVLSLATLAEVEEAGEGPLDVLLIPCMSCRWTEFQPFMERNSERYRMVAVTLPGYGGAPVPDLPYDPENLVWRRNALDALKRLVKEAGLGDFAIVAHSHGASFAIELAAEMPEQVRAVVNIDGFIARGRPLSPETDARRQSLEDTERDYMAPLFDAEAWRKFNTPTIFDPEERLRYHGMFMATPRRVLFAYWAENLFFDVDGVLARVKAPILDIKAIRPSQEPDATIERHRETMRAAGSPETLQTVFFLNTRHHIPANRPNELDEVVDRFLAGVPLRGFYELAELGMP